MLEVDDVGDSGRAILDTLVARLGSTRRRFKLTRRLFEEHGCTPIVVGCQVIQEVCPDGGTPHIAAPGLRKSSIRLLTEWRPFKVRR